MLDNEYDIFVSHSYADTENVKAEVSRWESGGDYKIFADFKDEWLRESSLRGIMDYALANHLRQAIRRSLMFVFVVSRNSVSSGWMPWELGLAHGSVGRVHLYLLEPGAMEACSKREYLQLYAHSTFTPENAEQYLAQQMAFARSELNPPAIWERNLELGKKLADATQAHREFTAILEQGGMTAKGFGQGITQTTSALPTTSRDWKP